MDELTQEVQAEKEHILGTLRVLEKVLDREEKTIIELSAIATFLQDTYNGMENILKRILKSKGIPVPRTGSSHKDLLNTAVDNQIISYELSRRMDEYRAFRHFFVHGYGIMLDEEKLMPLAKGLPGLWGNFEHEVNAFITHAGDRK